MRDQVYQVALKIEASEGVPEALAAADVINAASPVFTPDVKMTELKQSHGTMSPGANRPGLRSAKIAFDVYLVSTVASGAVPFYSSAMRCSGWDETTTVDATTGALTSVAYSPAAQTTVIPSCTVAVLRDGVMQRIWGARGDVSMKFADGVPVALHFEFTGGDWEVVDSPLFTGVVYDDTEPPVFMNAGLTVGGYSAVLTTLDFKLASTVALRKSVNASGGHLSARITGRKPTVSLDPEDVAVATNDFWGAWKAGSTAALAANVGPSVAIAAPKLQYQSIKTSQRDGLSTLNVSALCCRDVGDDEFTITLT